MNFIKKNWHKIVLSCYFLLTPFSLLYAEGFNCPPGTICDPLEGKVGSIPDLIKKILEGVVKIGIPVVALAIVYCGFLFVYARGNPEKLKKAKDTLLYTLIGAAILLGAWAIANMIQSTVFAL